MLTDNAHALAQAVLAGNTGEAVGLATVLVAGNVHPMDRVIRLTPDEWETIMCSVVIRERLACAEVADGEARRWDKGSDAATASKNIARNIRSRP